MNQLLKVEGCHKIETETCQLLGREYLGNGRYGTQMSVVHPYFADLVVIRPVDEGSMFVSEVHTGEMIAGRGLAMILDDSDNLAGLVDEIKSGTNPSALDDLVKPIPDMPGEFELHKTHRNPKLFKSTEPHPRWYLEQKEMRGSEVLPNFTGVWFLDVDRPLPTRIKLVRTSVE